jgi:hypothetical protein
MLATSDEKRPKTALVASITTHSLTTVALLAEMVL